MNYPRHSDRGWSVELALPWKALGELARRPSPPRDGDQWRVNFSRVQWQLDRSGAGYAKRPNTKEDNWVWSPQGVVDMHRPERWGYVQFSTAAPGAAKFHFDSGHTPRFILHGWYYAQREFRRQNNRWAATFEELFPPSRSNVVVDANPVLFESRLLVAGDQFEMSFALHSAAGERWYIRQDSLIWKK